MDAGGQEGFYDALLFLTIISVASCLVLTSAVTLMRPDEEAIRNASLSYARSSLDAILSSTLSEAFYTGRDGGSVILANNTTVEDFLLAETSLVSQGLSITAFADCNLRIERMSRNLLTGAYGFSLEAGVAGGDRFQKVFALGMAKPAAGYSAASLYSISGESIGIELTLWWM